MPQRHPIHDGATTYMIDRASRVRLSALLPEQRVLRARNTSPARCFRAATPG